MLAAPFLVASGPRCTVAVSDLRAYSTGLSISWLIAGPDDLDVGRAVLGLGDGDALLLGVSAAGGGWAVPAQRLNGDVDGPLVSLQTRGPAGGGGMMQAYWWAFPGPGSAGELTITAQWAGMGIEGSTRVPIAVPESFTRLPRPWTDV